VKIGDTRITMPTSDSECFFILKWNAVLALPAGTISLGIILCLHFLVRACCIGKLFFIS
jgi:hypothetical protein